MPRIKLNPGPEQIPAVQLPDLTPAALHFTSNNILPVLLKQIEPQDSGLSSMHLSPGFNTPSINQLIN
jgi:hypothetical protein